MRRREKIGDVGLTFDDEGRGPPLVLLHPFPFDARIWAGNVPALVVGNQRVIALDYPGFGDSPAPTRPLSISDLGDLVAGLLDRLSIGTATLVGLSMGGYVALAFAARFPRRLDGLVLADTRAAADTPVVREARAAALAVIRDRGVDAYLAQAVPKLLAPDAPTEVLTHALALAEKRSDSLSAALSAMRDREDRSGDLGAIDCPTLVLAGEADGVTPASEMRTMAGAMARASFVTIPRVGHLSNLEAPLEFNLALLVFLRGVPTLAIGGEPE